MRVPTRFGQFNQMRDAQWHRLHAAYQSEKTATSYPSVVEPLNLTETADKLSKISKPHDQNVLLMGLFHQINSASLSKLMVWGQEIASIKLVVPEMLAAVLLNRVDTLLALPPNLRKHAEKPSVAKALPVSTSNPRQAGHARHAHTPSQRPKSKG